MRWFASAISERMRMDLQKYEKTLRERIVSMAVEFNKNSERRTTFSEDIERYG
ncbi:MAG: hypothetical protein AABX66_03925 [Nanoarchaeota archaeon]